MLYGSKLGQLSPVVGGGAQISEFAAPGKKMYSMELTKPDGTLSAIIKAKGVRLTADNDDKLNHLMFKRLVTKLDEKITVNYATHFTRSSDLSNISVGPLSKVIKTTLNARFYYGYRSVPWGWKCELP